MTDEAARRAELATLIETGWTNTTFSRCSFCGKGWNDGVGHDHGQGGAMDPDPPYGFILVYEDRGGTIKFDCEKAADAVIAYVADAVAQAVKFWQDNDVARIEEIARLRGELAILKRAIMPLSPLQPGDQA